MSRIAHLSDVHFGANDPRIVAAAEAWLLKRRPDLVVISGDLTQRAREGQYRAASAWLNRLQAHGLKLLVIPGNHDISLWNLWRRFAKPLERYKRFIGRDLCPWHEDDDVAVLGLNTARSLTIKDGRINAEQMALMRERFGAVERTKTFILVTHHPLFQLPIGEGGELTEAVGRHAAALKAAREAGVRVALAGHFHRTYAEAAGAMTTEKAGVLVVQAGTATSTRLRNKEPQSFNWLHVERNDRFAAQVIVWDGATFRDGAESRFAYLDGAWREEAATATEQAQTRKRHMGTAA